MYEVNGWYKFAEVDHPEHGCDPDSFSSWGGDDTFHASTIEAMLEQLRNFVGVDDDYELLLDSCEEDGRVDIQVMEDAEGYVRQDPRALEQWRAGELTLWAATYTFVIEEVTRKPVRLKEM